MDPEGIEVRFNCHNPEGDKVFQHQRVRTQCKRLVYVPNEIPPAGYEKDSAIKSLEEARVWANVAIARRA